MFVKSGDGSSRSSRAFGASFEPKILADEMELLRKIFPLGKSSYLQHFLNLRYNLLVTVDAEWQCGNVEGTED